jgi:hypothetical protein
MTNEERALLMHISRLVQMGLPALLNMIRDVVVKIGDDELTLDIAAKVQAWHLEYDLMNQGERI